MGNKFIHALCSPYTFWMKDNKTLFYDDIRNGILLYMLFLLISMSGYFYEAVEMFNFVFSKMILIIFLPSLFISILFYIYSILFNGLILDKIFIFYVNNLAVWYFFH